MAVHAPAGRDGPLNYDGFIASVGALAMGSTTYEWVLEHEFRKPPEEGSGRTTFPAGSSRIAISGWSPARTSIVSGDVTPIHEEMRAAAGGKNVWVVGGGDLAGQFADAGLLDEMIVYVAPVTLGAGKPLLPRRIELRLEETARNGDFVCARYSVAQRQG